MKVKLLSHVRLFGTPWTVAYQDPWSMGFSRQEYWSGLRVPYLGVLPNPGIEPRSPASQADALLEKLGVMKGHSLVHTLSIGLSKNSVSNNHQGQSPVTSKPLEDTVPALWVHRASVGHGTCGVVCVCVRAELLQPCPHVCNPMECSPPCFSALGFSRREYWSELPCSPPVDVPKPVIKPTSLMSPTLTGRFLTTKSPGKPPSGYCAGPQMPMF